MVELEQRFYYLLGWLCERIGQGAQADRAYRRALTRRNRYAARAACALARLCSAREGDDEAESWLLEALRLDPGNGRVHYNLGYVRERMRRFEDAINSFRTAVRLDPELDRAWYGLGLCEAALGRHERAAAAFEEAATRQPENPFPWYQLGMAYHILGERRKVKEIAEHVVRFHPRMARKLIRDTGRDDLAWMVQDLRD